MSDPLGTLELVRAAVAVVVVLGAVTATAARQPRLAILGLLVVLLASSSVLEPVPDALSTAPRLLGGVLAGYLLWIGVRDVPAGVVRGTRIGWLAELLVAAAAGVAGVAIGSGLLGDAAIVAGDGVDPDRARVVGGLAAALAIGVVAAGPIILGRDILRTGIGLVLAVAAADLAIGAFGGVASGAGGIDTSRAVGYAVGVAQAVIAGAVAWQCHAALRDTGDLEIQDRAARAAPRPRQAADG